MKNGGVGDEGVAENRERLTSVPVGVCPLMVLLDLLSDTLDQRPRPYKWLAFRWLIIMPFLEKCVAVQSEIRWFELGRYGRGFRRTEPFLKDLNEQIKLDFGGTVESIV